MSVVTMLAVQQKLGSSFCLLSLFQFAEQTNNLWLESHWTISEVFFLADVFSVLWLLAYFGLEHCLNFMSPLDSEVLECKAGKVIWLRLLRVLLMMSLLVQLIINSAGYNILDVELWLFSDEVPPSHPWFSVSGWVVAVPRTQPLTGDFLLEFNGSCSATVLQQQFTGVFQLPLASGCGQVLCALQYDMCPTNFWTLLWEDCVWDLTTIDKKGGTDRVWSHTVALSVIYSYMSTDVQLHFSYLWCSVICLCCGVSFGGALLGWRFATVPRKFPLNWSPLLLYYYLV